MFIICDCMIGRPPKLSRLYSRLTLISEAEPMVYAKLISHYATSYC